MSIELVQGDIRGWRVSVIENDAPKDMTGATVTATIKLNGVVYAQTAILEPSKTAANVLLDTSALPSGGQAVAQCRFELAGQIATAHERLQIRDTAFA